jgi:hypothetical protein
VDGAVVAAWRAAAADAARGDMAEAAAAGAAPEAEADMDVDDDDDGQR